MCLRVDVKTKNETIKIKNKKAVVVFLKEERQVYQLIESGLYIRDGFVQVSPLSVPSTRITVSGVLPFIYQMSSYRLSSAGSENFLSGSELLI